jgi:hypothetical protein
MILFNIIVAKVFRGNFNDKIWLYNDWWSLLERGVKSSESNSSSIFLFILKLAVIINEWAKIIDPHRLIYLVTPLFIINYDYLRIIPSKIVIRLPSPYILR